MSLSASTLAAPAAPGLVRLDEKTWAAVVADYATAIAAKKAAEASARAADTAAKALRSRLLAAMGSAPAAVCGERVLTAKTTAGAAASLTLQDGEKIAWDAVSGVTVGNRYVAAETVATIYGGRSGSTDLTVTG